MSASLSEYFADIESRLIECTAIVSYEMVRRENTLYDGKIRFRARLINDGKLECFLYVSLENGHFRFDKYSYHWQDARQTLIKRWDNAPHFPELPNAPHHIHKKDGSVSALGVIPDIFQVIDEIERKLIAEP